MFANNSFIFSVVNDTQKYAMNKDLETISKWANQRKMTLPEKCRSFFCSVFSCIRTEYEDLRSAVSPNTGKYGPQKKSYLDIFSRSVSFNSLMHNVQKWSDTLQKSYSI